MRHLVIIVLAIAAAVGMHIMKKHREKIFIATIFMAALICGVYSFTHADSVLASVRPLNQTFYTPDFINSQEFPDAFLRLYLKDKTVYTKNDYWTQEMCDEAGLNWTYSVYHVHSMKRYLDSVGAGVVMQDEINSVTVPSELRADFEDLGYINDLLRNTMMYTEYDSEVGNYFFYLWYYRDKASSSNMYVNADSLEGENELVLIWQQKDGQNQETEDMYLMGKTYFDEKFPDMNFK